MSDQELSEKIAPVEAWVGSTEWVKAVQENILDNRSRCFACGEDITYRLDFFYMRGHLGTVMLHDKCFSPYGKKSKGRVVYINSDNPATYSEEAEVAALLKLDWWTLREAADYLGITYNALYQRFWMASGFLAPDFEKRGTRWFVSRRAVQAMDKGKRALGRPRTRTVEQPVRKSRIWRSEVTESIARILASEAARRIGMSRTWVLQRKEKFDAVKIAGEWRLSEKLVDDYVKAEEERYGGVSTT